MLFRSVNICPLGSAAFASTGFAIDRFATAEHLGFSGPMTNSMDAVSSRDFLIECAAVFSNIMINLSRMAEELILWSSTEFHFVELDDTYASTSSIMPQKKNPDTAELMRGKSGTVVGSLMSLLTICKGLPLSYNRDLQEATPHIIKSAGTAAASVRMMSGIMETLTVREEVMKNQSASGFTTATELADTMVREAGIPFRTAHQIVGTLSRSEKTPTLKDIDSVSSQLLGYKLSDKGLTAKSVAEALDPVSNVQRRAVIGGPAPDRIEKDIEIKKKRLEALQKNILALDLSVQKALENLTEEVKKLI